MLGIIRQNNALTHTQRINLAMNRECTVPVLVRISVDARFRLWMPAFIDRIKPLWGLGNYSYTNGISPVGLTKVGELAESFNKTRQGGMRYMCINISQIQLKNQLTPRGYSSTNWVLLTTSESARLMASYWESMVYLLDLDYDNVSLGVELYTRLLCRHLGIVARAITVCGFERNIFHKTNDYNSTHLNLGQICRSQGVYRLHGQHTLVE